MTFAIAAAGTGGHVYPGLAVGEALSANGVKRRDILFVGGRRLESTVYPAAGFSFLELELRGLQRRLTLSNLGIPWIVLKATAGARKVLTERNVRVLLGMGGYVTVPTGIGARTAGVAVLVAEQNAQAGLANRVVSRFARRTFGAFPETEGLPRAEWVGNPIRGPLARFDRSSLRGEAFSRYRLEEGIPVVGVAGGSLGAGVINRQIRDIVCSWSGPPVQVVQLAGAAHEPDLAARQGVARVPWRIVGFEDRMDLFYAACDLVISRAGGAVAELTATRTPSILIPGGFGSGSHQAANAAALAGVGAAVVVDEGDLAVLDKVVADLIADGVRLSEMADATAELARADAAETIARAMLELHG